MAKLNVLKDKKKVDIKKKNAKDDAVEEQVFYEHDEEMMKAINQEKAKYRFKLTLIKYWAINNMNKISNNSQILYSKLEDWIILGYKAEMEALSKMVII